MSAPAAAAAPEGAEAAPKKGKKKLILILALVLVLLGGGGGGYYFFVMKPAKAKAAAEAAAAEEEDEEDEDAAKKAEAKKKKDKKKKKKKKKENAHIEFMQVEPWFTFNLMDKDPERSGQIGLVYELSSTKAAADLKFKMHVVRSRILFLLSGKYSADIKTPEGKEKLQAQILEVTREAVDTEAAAEIDNVHFSIFVVQ